jgi:high-affinity iron transporter
VSAGSSPARPRARTSRETVAFSVWTAIVLVGAVLIVVFSWHAHGGTTDPTGTAPHQLGRTTVVIDSAILVFREGLECILVLAAITASLRGANQLYRRPISVGSAAGIVAGVATWFAVVWFIGRFHGSEYSIQAATGIPALIILLLVMNWFFHKVYWTGWISSHNRRRKSLLSADPDAGRRRMLLGLALLGFTSVYREAFEIVIFLQALRELYGSGVVLEGVVIGLLFTAAVGVLTFVLHARLPYKRLLIITGVLLLLVLLVQVGEEVNEMQLAGWISTTTISWLQIPGWMGTWLSLFNNWETFLGQFIALVIVVGSYAGAQYLRVWRPRRRGERGATLAKHDPQTPADGAGEVPGPRVGTPAHA